MDVLEHIEQLRNTPLHARILRSIALLRRTFDLYPKHQVAFSFNGGKDSTVLLHLLRAAVAMDLIAAKGQEQVMLRAQPTAQQALPGTACNGSPTASLQTEPHQVAPPVLSAPFGQPASTPASRSHPTSGELGGVRNFFFVHDADFTEVKQFVRDCDARHALAVDYLTDPDFKHGLQSYLAVTGVTAVVLGTRSGDPNAGDQEHFCPSSPGWPAFMRVNPILDWTYHEVWIFLRTIKVEYCSLYDQGYTSLGSIHNTLQNSSLLLPDGSYSPAYLLEHGHLERAGGPADLPHSRSRATSVMSHNRRQQQQRRQQCAVSDKTATGPGELKAAEERGAVVAASCSSDTIATGVAWDPGSGQKRHTAAIVIIGDEILSGKVHDSNSGFLCSEMRAIGWSVGRIVTVLDDVEAIAAEVRNCSSSYELVITSGGVGPTLDDVTMDGVALAFGQKLVRNAAMEARLANYFGERLTESHLKMAQVLRLSLSDEALIAPALTALSALYPGIQLGSYPVSSEEDDATLLITLDSKCEASLQLALDFLASHLPVGCTVLGEDTDVRVLLSPRT
ncbi:MAG: hypothetical protein WDW38_001273 [Sanguina aurantia]